MGFISPLLLTQVAQMSIVPMTTSATMLTAMVAKDFFLDLFLNPQNHVIAVMILGGVTVAAFVGSAFLIKLLYDKYHPKKT
jgi:hypothetical protein